MSTWNAARQPLATATPLPAGTTRPDVVLVEEGRRPAEAPTAAQELFTDELFARARGYARATGSPWFVLSAAYGLLAPEQVVAPYELALATASSEFCAAWAGFAVARLEAALGPLRRRRVELHLLSHGTAEALRGALLATGALVLEPLRGLPVPDRVDWYEARAGLTPRAAAATGQATTPALDRLADATAASPPSDVLASVDAALRGPGLAGWFVDAAGARQLSEGLGAPVASGLVWVGQAGGVRPGSGPSSTATLRTQLAWVDLGRSARLSPLRRVLGAALVRVPDAGVVSEDALTEWMHAHLRIVTLAVPPEGLVELVEELGRRLAPQLSPQHCADPTVRAAVAASRAGFDGFGPG